MNKPKNCFLCAYRVSDVCSLSGKPVLSGYDVCVKFVFTPAVDSYSSIFVCMSAAQRNYGNGVAGG